MSSAEDRAAHSPPGDPVFAARDLSYTYLDRFPALDRVSFDIHPGEQVALLGANGSGKSTLLKILAGLIVPTSGTLSAFGHPMTEGTLDDEQFSAGFRSRVGIVFQNPDTQVFSATVREEVAFGCLQLRLPQEVTAQRISDILTLLDIADLADRAPFQLSGGQKKKVALASVLVMNPEVLLFDEPTAALDPRTQHWLIDLIVQLGASGKTIVIATHDLHTLADLTTRAVVFAEDHSIRCDGRTDDILLDHDTLHAVNLIHDPAAR